MTGFYGRKLVWLTKSNKKACWLWTISFLEQCFDKINHCHWIHNDIRISLRRFIFQFPSSVSNGTDCRRDYILMNGYDPLYTFSFSISPVEKSKGVECKPVHRGQWNQFGRPSSREFEQTFVNKQKQFREGLRAQTQE